MNLKYHYTDKSEDDITNILDYGIDKYGIKMAVFYYDALIKKCEDAADRPHTFPKFDLLYPKSRRAKSDVHNIYVVENESEIIIGRILHLRAEYSNHLK